MISSEPLLLPNALETPILFLGPYPIGIAKFEELPFEVVANIPSYLTFPETNKMGQTCKKLQKFVDVIFSSALLSKKESMELGQLLLKSINSRVQSRSNVILKISQERYCEPGCCECNTDLLLSDSCTDRLCSLRITAFFFRYWCHPPFPYCRPTIKFFCSPCTVAICVLPCICATFIDLGVDIKNCCARSYFKAFTLPRYQRENERDLAAIQQIDEKVKALKALKPLMSRTQ